MRPDVVKARFHGIASGTPGIVASAKGGSIRRQHTSEPAGVSMTRVPFSGNSKLIAIIPTRNWQSGKDVTNVSTRARSYTKLLRVTRPAPGGSAIQGSAEAKTELITPMTGSPGGGSAAQDTSPNSAAGIKSLR